MSSPLARLLSVLPLLLAVACEADDSKLPSGGDDTAEQGALPACPTGWSDHTDGIELQGGACLAWSPMAAEAMDWYAAVSPEDAVAGGCSAHCAEEPGYCAELELAGIDSWRLPSKAELEAAGTDASPLEPLDSFLWSRDSVAVAEDMAYQVELEAPEQDFMQGKTQDGWVRCVADL